MGPAGCPLDLWLSHAQHDICIHPRPPHKHKITKSSMCMCVCARASVRKPLRKTLITDFWLTCIHAPHIYTPLHTNTYGNPAEMEERCISAHGFRGSQSATAMGVCKENVCHRGPESSTDWGQRQVLPSKVHPWWHTSPARPHLLKIPITFRIVPQAKDTSLELER